MKTNNELNLRLIKENNLDELLRVNRKYIEAIAKSYKQDESILKDLVQEGRIALIEAVSKFDSNINPNFLNIATYYIRKYMINYLSSNVNTITLPTHYWRTKNQIDKKINNDELYDIYSDKDLTNGERLAYTNAKRIISGDLSNDEGNSIVFNSIAYNEGDYNERTEQEYQARHRVFSLIEKLTKESDKEIIRAYYGIDTEQLNMIELAEKLNCTRQNIEQKIKRIIKKLSTF
jgi:RNA polymerase sigma factor (sigma-70 family)